MRMSQKCFHKVLIPWDSFHLREIFRIWARISCVIFSNFPGTWFMYFLATKFLLSGRQNWNSFLRVFASWEQIRHMKCFINVHKTMSFELQFAQSVLFICIKLYQHPDVFIATAFLLFHPSIKQAINRYVASPHMAFPTYYMMLQKIDTFCCCTKSFFLPLDVRLWMLNRCLIAVMLTEQKTRSD